MTRIQPSPTVCVTLRESTVALLMTLRSNGETLDAVTARCADAALKASAFATSRALDLPPATPIEPAPAVAPTVSTWPIVTSGTYVASVLGVPVGAPTLGELLRNIVDAVHDLDASAIERLAEMKARTRRYVAHQPEDVHAGRRDLRVLRTASGWWVSANIGRPDLVRSLRALCRASGLSYGHDIRFPARSPHPPVGGQ